MVRKPNVIFIIADDLGYGDLGCYGRAPSDYTTPNIDKLASDGIRFNYAYAAAPECTPTRCAFITGRYPHRLQVGLREPLDFGDTSASLPLSQPTVASLLKGNGYATALIGKWHLGCPPNPDPTQFGFDEFFGIRGPAVDYFLYTDFYGNPDLYDLPVQSLPTGQYLTEAFTQRAIDYIGSAAKPFFLSLQFTAPHWPWEAPNDPHPIPVASWMNSMAVYPQAYARMMTAFDANIGQVMAALDAAGIANDTLVIFTSDNGGDSAFSNRAPLSGAKFELREGGIRVPAIVRWPAALASGVVLDQVAITMDWTATILAATRTSADPVYPLDGDDLLGVMRRPVSARDMLCEWVRSILPAYAPPPFILPKPQYPRTLYWRTGSLNNVGAQDAMRRVPWKYYRGMNADYLFDLPNDPSESNNLAVPQATMLADMKNSYDNWDLHSGMLARP